METDKIYNLIILDESGSMEIIKKATITGFNEVVQNIKNIEKQFPEQKHFITFVTFNGNGIKTKLDKMPVVQLDLIDENTYQPDSMTPLYDALGLSILKLRHDLAGEKNARVLVTVLTDGEENASEEFTGSQIKKMIEEQKVKGWTFTYIGANHDVEKAAISISITNTMKFEPDEESMKEMFIKENKSRVQYSQRIRDKQEKGEGFYDDKV